MEEKTLKNMVYGNTVDGIYYPVVYHVSPFGDDNNDGVSWDSAFCTTAKGLSVLQSGDTLKICEGTYSEVVKK